MKTYGELKAAIADYVNREDIAEHIPDFVRLAETKIYRGLRTRENEFLVEYVATDDPFNPITLPQNFREVKFLTVNGVPGEHISDQEFRERERQSWGYWEVSMRFYFTIIERSLYLYPWPTETQTEEEWGESKISMTYYGTESLTDMATWPTPTNPNSVPESTGTPVDTAMRANNATTRLLQVAPDALLYGSLAEAYLYLKAPEESMAYTQMAISVVQTLKAENDEATLTGSTVAVGSTYYDGVD